MGDASGTNDPGGSDANPFEAPAAPVLLGDPVEADDDEPLTASLLMGTMAVFAWPLPVIGSLVALIGLILAWRGRGEVPPKGSRLSILGLILSLAVLAGLALTGLVPIPSFQGN